MNIEKRRWGNRLCRRLSPMLGYALIINCSRYEWRQSWHTPWRVERYGTAREKVYVPTVGSVTVRYWFAFFALRVRLRYALAVLEVLY